MKPQKQEPDRGHLKIFFGYAPGTGKTYGMLRAAHGAKDRGIDLVVGYMEDHGYAQTAALTEGLEKLPTRLFRRKSGIAEEFDLDGAIARKPQLILIDGLAHTNQEGSRHTKRYQDVRELLNAGIDVYTTVNVQHIESLSDTVTAILGMEEEERIPDFVFDNADQVELTDIEPEELMERLVTPVEMDRLTALREIALRRCADRMNLLTEQTRIKKRGDYHTEEHVLVCLSSAPSNGKIIRTAARMANAFRSAFTALYVETPDFSAMEEEDKRRLREHMHLARQLGAKIETVYGHDISYQIAEFARLSGVSKIVIGRSTATRRGFPGKPALTDKLIANAPNLDIHIIPDSGTGAVYRMRKAKQTNSFREVVRNGITSTGILLLATLIGYGFFCMGLTEANIITVYILGVLIISILTTGWKYSFASSLISVLVFNFFFTEPQFTFRAYDTSYPVTFLVMFLAAFLTGSLAARMKDHARQAAQAAYRTNVLLDTNQLLQQAKGKEEIMKATASQLIKLLGKNVVAYFSEQGELSQPYVFSAVDKEKEQDEIVVSEEEQAVAAWVMKNNKRAGATTDTFSGSGYLYMALRVNNNVYGVLGIELGEQPLDAFENSVTLSILGESALALENEKNAHEKEEAAIMAKNEQLRANLLRAISHDLRTPLTSISGNASNLLSNGDQFGAETRQQIYTDIYDDSMWLINLVENLLSVTRIEEGRMNIHPMTELMDEVISEALRHINRKSVEHKITVRSREEILLAKIDARLIVQVFINMIDNAVKYTPKGSEITIDTRKEGNEVVVEVGDNGPGIPEEAKAHVFDMFYSGANKIADSRRSLGLGLSLCKSIIMAHGGQIYVSDNQPHGTVFTFTLPAGEVTLHE